MLKQNYTILLVSIVFIVLNIGLSLVNTMAVIPLVTVEKAGAELTEDEKVTADRIAHIKLTKKERDWLAAHPVIRVAVDTNWAPIEYLDKEGNLQGMSMDYLQHLEKMLGVRFEIPTGLSWKETVEAVKNKELDMFASFAWTPERETYFHFTEPYVSMPIHIYTSREVAYISSPADLKGKRVAVMEGYAIHEWLQRDFPSIELIPVRTIPDGLRMLTKGSIYAFVGNAVTTSYYIHKLRLYEVHVAGETPYMNNQTMAVRGDWPILADILEKALGAIPRNKRDLINNRWMAIRYEHGVDYTLLWQVTGAAALVLFAVAYWNRRLRKEVAARKATETALQQSEKRLQMVVDTVPDVLVLKDRNGRHLLVNNSFEQSTGVKREDAIGKLDAEIFPPQVASTIRAFDEKLIASGKEDLKEEEVPHPDGTVHTYFSRKVPIFDDEGKVTGLVLAALDITEKKKAEQELLIAKEAAETANRAKSLFLANISHELRTPLNAILGFSEMMGRDRQMNSRQRERLAIINRNGEYLLGMINDVLDLSKIEAGRIVLEEAAFNLPLLLNDIEQMFDVRARKAGLNFELIPDSSLPSFIKSDAGKLRQILINLLGNAVKFSREGSIFLRVGTEPIRDKPELVALSLEVEDSGPGISEDEKKHIFEPFFRGRITEETLEGSGLGLAITKSFVELLGGEINVESRPGAGSVFRVELPVSVAHEDEVSGVKKARAAISGLAEGESLRRILVVEDNADNRLLLDSLLREAGFEVREAENGEQAVTLFKSWKPHFIWMDMRMPVMNGYEATAKIRSLPGGDDVKIVAITASAFKAQLKKIMEAGCDDVVHKPVQSYDIFDTMAKQLGVRYTYKEREKGLEEVKITLTAEIMERLPAKRRASLKKAAKRLDISATNKAIRNMGNEYPEIAEGLQKLVKEFRFDKILELLGSRN